MRHNRPVHRTRHRRLSYYHLRRWLNPNAEIPVPELTGPARFRSVLRLVKLPLPIGKRPWRLAADFCYRSAIIGKVVVPEGFRTDFASVPRPLWALFPPTGIYDGAALVHDWLYHLRGGTGVDRRTADHVFREAMRVAGVPAWKRWLMWGAVRMFGPRWTAPEEGDRTDEG